MSPRHGADSSRQPAHNQSTPLEGQTHTASSACTPSSLTATDSATVTAGPEAHPQLITHVQLRDEREDEGSRDDLSDAETRGTVATSTEEETHGQQQPTEAPQIAGTETAENHVDGGTSIFAEGADSAEERGKGDENEGCDRGPRKRRACAFPLSGAGDEAQPLGSLTVDTCTLTLASDSFLSLPGPDEGTSVMVNLAHFTLMEVLEKHRGPSGDEYVIVSKSSWPADQVKRMKLGHPGIRHPGPTYQLLP
jgi:hypothetical protein